MKYKLKKSAVPFFNEKYAITIAEWDFWERQGVDRNALIEIRPPYLSYGIKKSDNTNTLSGWNEREGASYEFTVHFPDMTFQEHDRFHKGRIMRDLMNEIQEVADRFFGDFIMDGGQGSCKG